MIKKEKVKANIGSAAEKSDHVFDSYRANKT